MYILYIGGDINVNDSTAIPVMTGLLSREQYSCLFPSDVVEYKSMGLIYFAKF